MVRWANHQAINTSIFFISQQRNMYKNKIKVYKLSARCIACNDACHLATSHLPVTPSSFQITIITIYIYVYIYVYIYIYIYIYMYIYIYINL